MQISVLGEGMLEMSRRDRRDDRWQLGFGGDTLNTAIHLARFGLPVAYVSALGNDPFSTALREEWAAEGLNVDHVLADPDHLPGLYAIRTDAQGERSFFYWRNDSAARHLLALPGIDAALAYAAGADLFYLSLISLAILSEDARARVYDLCAEIRQHGGRVAFDSNYRPALWDRPKSARAVACKMAALCDIGLPTLSDERLLFGSRDPDSVADRWHSYGTAEIAVKLGASGCLLSAAGRRRMVPAIADIDPVDTSGAGDAFNGGYLAARMRGLDAATACRMGHQLAGWVITRTGALPKRTAEAPYAPGV
ncbi:sugar kinase [Sphingomonas sp. KC8]|uniref:sugar kinase n=1 Tax=Sphingomonas sp. KC8 TaxID=1030157 RepID=UPI000495BD7E|nr:sugar kinase [Sphingomonas sp. KC8]